MLVMMMRKILRTSCSWQWVRRSSIFSTSSTGGARRPRPAGDILRRPRPLPSTQQRAFWTYSFPLRLSETGRAYIQSQENFSATPYPDGAHMSIYWGHQIQPGETFNGTRAEGDAVFNRDIARYEKAVSDALQVQVSQSQFDSLVDFCYDVGIGAFLSSTLLRLLNQGDFAGASQQFSRWVYSSGRVNSTLQARRADDLTLFQQA
jgi:lysozyme